MAKVEIYSTKVCPYCVKAKNLFSSKNIEYVEIDVTNDDEGRMKLLERSNGQRTVPQIFINDKHIGGCDDLFALNKSGALMPLLGE